ncbi:hypothetical protein BS50DRAFT_387471 [Corynespora cassiicola Philippines]|uniref:Uncharacterized protein n=1 Tax=Corynespora cassiicola Philippines TaxID=1448308 RepID=A0A2T2NPC2_CORCC|nr:hypothetical protein BS50DRAFT_387471 [Corynespora cassiicola Philippines]
MSLLLQPDSGPISAKALQKKVLCRWTGRGELDFWSTTTIRDNFPTSSKTARQISEKFVPLYTEGRYVEAFPDTGSELNIISKNLCHKFGLFLDTSQAQPVRKPTGRKIMTLGTVDLDFLFLMESSNYIRKFHVLERTVHDIILGKSFLETTQTLTTFAHRIKSRLVDINSRMGRLLLLGSGAERVVGSINSIPATAMDDTGSDVMVISWKEAERLRLHISTDVSHRKTLEFIDGEEIFTDGAVLGADWRFGSDTHAKAIRVDLQVVRDLECSLILSNEILFENDAYSNSDYFLEEEKSQYTKNQSASLCVIMDRTGRKPIIDSVADCFRSKSSRARMEDQGLVRKAERTFDDEVARQLAEEERINALPEQMRRDAWEREDETRRRWNQTFIPQLSGQFSSSASNTSASGTGGRPLGLGTATKWTSWKRRLRVISKKTGTDSVP